MPLRVAPLPWLPRIFGKPELPGGLKRWGNISGFTEVGCWDAKTPDVAARHAFLMAKRLSEQHRFQETEDLLRWAVDGLRTEVGEHKIVAGMALRRLKLICDVLTIPDLYYILLMTAQDTLVGKAVLASLGICQFELDFATKSEHPFASFCSCWKIGIFLWRSKNGERPRKFLGGINRSDDSLQLYESIISAGTKVLGSHNPVPKLNWTFSMRVRCQITSN